MQVMNERMSIGELADASGVTRRAIRFYVQHGLLDPPMGRGRGSHYALRHLEQLREIESLQQAGHALDAIGRIMRDQQPEDMPSRPAPAARKASRLRAELWTRMYLAEGVELQIDMGKHDLDAETLREIQSAVRDVIARQQLVHDDPEAGG